MFVSVRQYTSSDVAEVGRRAQEGFVPIVRELAGISAYYLVDTGDGGLTTITVAEDQASVEASVEKAREWVSANAADLEVSGPTVTNGEVVANI